MANAKFALATITGNVFSIKVDNPSHHSRILVSASIQKKVFRFSAIAIMYDKNVSKK